MSATMCERQDQTLVPKTVAFSRYRPSPIHTASNGQRFINMVEQGRDGFTARSPKYRPSRNSERGCLAYRVEPLFLFRIHEYKGKISRDRLGSARFRISAGIRIVAGSVVPGHRYDSLS